MTGIQHVSSAMIRSAWCHFHDFCFWPRAFSLFDGLDSNGEISYYIYQRIPARKKCSQKSIVFKVIKSLHYVFLVTVHGHVWPFSVFSWSCVAFMAALWSYMTFYWSLWCFLAKYRFDCTCIVLSRGHRSKFIWSCFIGSFRRRKRFGPFVHFYSFDFAQ